MCYICNCFSWTLDLFQRLITFGLACCLACAVCIGLTVAITAGMAYGYNYCMAEFITFTRSDVTVYMRRGQFYDKPDLDYRSVRRSGDAEDAFSSNATDYQDQKVVSDSKSLDDSWLKAHDTRKYAEKLTKFSKDEKVGDDEPVNEDVQRVNYFSLTEPPKRIISLVPHAPGVLMTTSWKSGTSEIVMRKFQPVDYVSSEIVEPSAENEETRLEFDRRTVDDHAMAKGTTKSKLLMRIWDATRSNKASTGSDYLIDDVDEDTVLYKPVK